MCCLKRFTRCFIWFKKFILASWHFSSIICDFIGQHQQFFIDVFNCILLSGVFPNVFKHGIIRPLPEHGNNKEAMSSYRRITNLSALRNNRKATLAQLSEHLWTNNLWPKFQSAYRKGILQKLVVFIAHTTIFPILILESTCMLYRWIFQQRLIQKTSQCYWKFWKKGWHC